MAARYHMDKHVRKMIIETAQLLCTAHWELGSNAPYKSTHRNHPCALWARESVANYQWLCNLGLRLCDQFHIRWGKRHKTQDVLGWCLKNLPTFEYPDTGFTIPPLAMPEECQPGVVGSFSDVVQAYRAYYITHKSHLAEWTRVGEPYWYSSSE